MQDADVTQPDAPEAPTHGVTGWAAVAGNGVTTTTGGGAAIAVVVDTATEFRNAVAGTADRVVHVSGEIAGDFVIGSNKTITNAPGTEGVLRGSLAFNGSVNVIMRNLRVIGHNCADTNDCGEGLDAITLRTGAHHIWLDHLDVSDGSDGNLDVISGSDYVTVSWSKFSYSPNRAPSNQGDVHRLSNLIGSSVNSAVDVGKLNVTYHHNWWAERVQGRMPYARYGKIHVYNNLYTATGNSSCVVASQDANILVENNVFVGSHNPVLIPASASAATRLEMKGNVFTNTTGNTTSNTGPAFTPPYTYAADPTANLAATIMAGVGPQ